MVVVVIIGILVAIAVPIYGAIQQRAEIQACEADQRILAGALTMWQMAEAGREGTLPDPITGLEVFFEGTIADLGSTAACTVSVNLSGASCTVAEH